MNSWVVRHVGIIKNGAFYAREKFYITMSKIIKNKISRFLFNFYIFTQFAIIKYILR